MESLRLDLKYALRSLSRRPGFYAAIVLTLGLGIGANTAIFTLTDALLLRPLPYPESDALVHVWQTVERDELERRSFSYPDYLDVRDRATSFEHLAAYQEDSVVIDDGGRLRVQTEIVTPGYFAVLGVDPLLGQTFSEKPAEAASQVVLGFDLWQRSWGGTADVVGQSMEVDGTSATIVGVMPSGFRGLSRDVEIWTSMAAVSTATLDNRTRRWHRVVGRLHEGVTPEQADLEVSTVFAGIRAENPRSVRDYGAVVVGLAEDLFGDLRRPLALLLGAVGLVLLIACSNVANLLLIRATGRRQENALRTALGASRLGLARQHLIETLFLGLGGGALAMLITGWGIELILALNPIPLPSFVRFELDWPVLIFNFTLALVTALALALVETWQVGELKLASQLRAGHRRGGGRQDRRTGRALVVAQMALAVVLLIGSGLMTRSLFERRAADPGFEAQDLLFLRIGLPTEKYSRPEAAQWVDGLHEEMTGLPGVQSVAFGRSTPLDGNASGIVVKIEGQSVPEGSAYDGLRVHRQAVEPGFFQTLGIGLLAGRDFGPQDTAESEPVVIVSEALARRVVGQAPPQRALGQRLERGDWRATIVGVVADVRHRALIAEGGVLEDPDVYFPFRSSPARDFAVAVRSSLDQAALLGPIRDRVTQLESQAVVYDVATLDDRIAQQVASPRFSTVLLGLFASLALALAALGLASVMGYEVAMRQREIGIRMALGARASGVLRMVVLESLGLIAAGVGLGLVLALGLTRLLETQLYNVQPIDRAAFAGMTLLLVAVALVASLLPARRAAGVDPIVSLRHE